MEKLFNDEQTAKETTEYAEAAAAGTDTPGMLTTLILLPTIFPKAKVIYSH